MSNKIKQEVDKIDIPKELHKRSEMGILKAKNERQRSRKRNNVKGIVVAAGLLVSIGIFSLVNNNFIKNSTTPNPDQNTVAVTESATDSIRTVDIEANYFVYETVDKLSQGADIILVASPIDDFANREHRSTKFEDGAIQDFYTLTNLNVEHIIKQPKGMNIGSQMQVNEPVSIITEADKQQTKVTVEEYREMKQGRRYIVFLKNNGMGGYSVINMNNGKFNLDGGDAQDIPTNTNEKAFKERLKKDIQSKFNVK
ncbi:hypothetical protein [Peribacillus loiseleuriae]|uniref:DUF4367 domain-containing protein n=1 Tax=Peribacillus loiseleuriae TaxID=1679170 RepID=A0A0K9GUT5_9BACI|nr:hypothetical protein [Peribacillus loiseleuriae]KMY49982.1 hypothetical protein AC625_11055 [Peribacillus loiseleuriae]